MRPACKFPFGTDAIAVILFSRGLAMVKDMAEFDPSPNGRVRLGAALGLAIGLSISPAFAVTVAIDNARVTAWDVPLAKGESAPATPADLDSVTMFLGGGTVTTKHADGSVTTAKREFGDAVFTPKGSNAVDTADSEGVHEVVVALKDAPSPPPNIGPAGIPAAFPRADGVKMLEGNRFIVWKFSWTKGKATAMHHHDKDIVMVFRYNGTLHSTPPEGMGEPRDLPFKKDQITFSKAGTTHTETLIDPKQSAVDLELK